MKTKDMKGTVKVVGLGLLAGVMAFALPNAAHAQSGFSIGVRVGAPVYGYNGYNAYGYNNGYRYDRWQADRIERERIAAIERQREWDRHHFDHGRDFRHDDFRRDRW